MNTWESRWRNDMIHSFDTEVAEKVGVTAAVLLQNIYFWTEKNRANGQNIHDGKAWTYNSKKAFSELFPYLTSRQIDYALTKLKERGIIVTGNYNKDPRDQTLWYAITDFGYSILQNCSMEETKLGTGTPKIVRPLPDSKQTDSKPDNKQENNSADALASTDTESLSVEDEFNLLWELYPRKRGKTNALKAYEKARTDKKNPVTMDAVKKGIEAYRKYLIANKTEERFIAHGSTWFNQRGWEDDYRIGGKAVGISGEHHAGHPEEKRIGANYL